MWPGRIERKESSSGAPRKIEGIKSRKVWVIAIAAMKIASVNGGVMLRRYVESERSIIARRFMWIPGIRPVIVPADTPQRIASISCNNMEFEGFWDL